MKWLLTLLFVCLASTFAVERNKMRAWLTATVALVYAFVVYVWVVAERITGGRPGVAVDLGDLLRLTFYSATFWLTMVLVFGGVFYLTKTRRL